MRHRRVTRLENDHLAKVSRGLAGVANWIGQYHGRVDAERLDALLAELKASK